MIGSVGEFTIFLYQGFEPNFPRRFFDRELQNGLIFKVF